MKKRLAILIEALCSRSSAGVSMAVSALFAVAGLAFMPASAAAAASAATMEERILQMERELKALKEELKRAKEASQEAATKPQQEVKELERRVARVEQAAPAAQKSQNMLFFRGGFASLIDDRGNQSITDAFKLGGANDRNGGWYVGAGFDFNLTDNVWGLMSRTSVLAELGVEFKRFKSKQVVQVVPTAVNCLLNGNDQIGNCAPEDLARDRVTLTMLSVTASPKIKFFEGSRLRPWIIPVGLGIHVISPPSDAVTVLDVGAHFGAGFDYELIRGVRVGIDSRYNLTGNFTDDNRRGRFKNDFWTVGGYVGLHF